MRGHIVKSIPLQYDNARPYSAKATGTTIQELKFTSPLLFAPSDCHVFGQLKEALCGKVMMLKGIITLGIEALPKQ